MALPRVLIVEDEPDNQEIVRAVVEEMVGVAAILAGDGLEAVAVAQRDKPDLVLLDLMPPRLDGYEVARKLKGDAETKGISLLGYVSHVQGELKQQAQEAGCNMVLARSAFSQNIPQIFKRHSSS